jgi:hypothetical protein
MQQQLQHPSVVRIFGVIDPNGRQSQKILGETYFYPAIVMREFTWFS